MKKIVISFILYTLFSHNAFSQEILAGTVDGSISTSSTGSAIYNIPIEVPKGLNDLEPQISLSYESNAGNGIAGWGWNIGGISSITRVPRNYYYDGTARGVIYERNDAYALDGKRLFLISGTEGTSGAIYKFESDDFTEIKAVNVHGTTGPGYFELRTQEGIIYKYGLSNTSKITYDTAPYAALVWFLDQIQDQFGNIINFTYEKGNTTYTYLTKIEYGGKINSGIINSNSIEFVYETRTDPIYLHTLKKKGVVKSLFKFCSTIIL